MEGCSRASDRVHAGRTNGAFRGVRVARAMTSTVRERWTMNKSMMVAAILVLGLVTAGCGGDDSDGEGGGLGGGSGGSSGNTAGSGGGGDTRNGITPCGNFPDQQAKSCQAGQYCEDEILSKCTAGCLSNTNCASNQTCEKASGADVGSCQNMATSTDCGPVCDRVLACDNSITRPMCVQFCAGFNEACKKCILAANCTDTDACNDACDL